MLRVSETERYAAAWKDRRRRFLVYVLVLNSFWILVLFGILSQVNPHFDLPGKTVVLAFAAWFLGQLAAGVWLNRFYCPRCGNLFYWKWSWKIEMTREWRRCRNCGLMQDSPPELIENLSPTN
jgi:hypothetical protein